VDESLSLDSLARSFVLLAGKDKRADDALKIQAHLRGSLRRHTFFLTKDNHMGFAFNPEPGDVIVLFAGAKLPMLLRTFGDCYHLVAPAYISGIMEGEAWPNDLKPEDLQLFTLV